MENWIIEILNLPTECQVEEVLPKGFLSSNFDLSAGEMNLQNYTIKEMAIVGAIGADFGDVPAGEGIESAAVLLVEMTGGKFVKESNKVADMLQKYLPQHLIIGLTDGENARLNIARKKTNEDGSVVVEEAYSTAVFSPEEVETVAQKLRFDRVSKENMSQLWADYCQAIEQL